jgi:CYTH domain-containing protein
MSIENERKYVLLPTNDVGFMTDLELMPDATVHRIFQAYLPGGPRIRSIKNKYDFTKLSAEGELVPPASGLYKFTYKLMVNSELIEIETDIEKSDFDKLAVASSGRISKTRVTIPDGNLNWEVDFFHDEINANLYLVMAEVELPEGVDAPATVPAFVADNLLYLVERDDLRFVNSNLSDPNAVRATVAHIKKEKDGDQSA